MGTGSQSVSRELCQLSGAACGIGDVPGTGHSPWGAPALTLQEPRGWGLPCITASSQARRFPAASQAPCCWNWAASAQCEGRAAGRGAQVPPRLSPGTRLAPTQPGAVRGGERLPQRGAWLPAPHPLAPFLASSGAARPGHRRACPHHVLTRARARLRGVASWHWHGDTESCGHPTAPRGAPGTQPCCPDPAALQPCRFLPRHLQPWHSHRLPKARDVGTLGACWWLSGQGWGRGSSGMGPVCPGTLQGSWLSARLWMCRWASNSPCLARGEPGGGCCGVPGEGQAVPPQPHAPRPAPGLPPAAVMANKGPAYGMSRDVQSKIEKKYDDELEDRLVEWIVAQCGASVGRPDRGRLGFQVWLKNGIVSAGPGGWQRGRAGSSASLSPPLPAGAQPAGEQPLPRRLQARQDPRQPPHHGVQADGADRPVPQGG